MFQSVLIAVRLSVVACFAVILALMVAPVRALAQQEHFDALANAPFSENRPTPETSKLLKEELLFQRATQTYLWALINTLGMKVGSEKTFGSGYNVLPVWKKRLDAKPTIGGNAFFGDVGFAGPDGGKGRKFLIRRRAMTSRCRTAISSSAPVPATSSCLRSFYDDPNNLTPAVQLMEQAKIYPLGGEASAKPMQFPDASGVPVNMLPTSDDTAFDQLKLLVDSEGQKPRRP